MLRPQQRHAVLVPLLMAALGAALAMGQQACSLTPNTGRALDHYAPAAPKGGVGVCPLVVGVFPARLSGPWFTGAGIKNDINPVTAFLVKARGVLFLVDGGLVATDHMPLIMRNAGGAPGYELAGYATARAQLEQVGIRESDLSFLVVTHAHGDHTGAAEAFPGLPLLMSSEEVKWVRALLVPRSDAITWRSQEAWNQLLPRVQSVQWNGQLADSGLSTFDLFDDGSVVFLHTPGHTPGSMSVMLQTGPDQRTVLLGDAALTEKSVRQNIPSGLLGKFVDDDIRASERTLSVLHRLIRDDPRWRPYPSHDERLLAERHTFESCAKALLALP